MASYKSIVLLLVALPVTIFATCSYSQFGDDHTMCKYQAKTCAPGDANCKKGGITAADINVILKTHNDFRSKVASGQESGQPKGSNIREMKYSNELATVAQRWADQNTFGHDANRRTAEFSYVGQNAAMTMLSAPTKGVIDFKRAITMWYNEVKDFKKTQISPFQFSTGTGHYSQVLWAETDRVGCGFSYYLSNKWYTNLYICNYGMGGNIIGTSMYSLGEPANACTRGKSSTYPSLCAS